MNPVYEKNNRSKLHGITSNCNRIYEQCRNVTWIEWETNTILFCYCLFVSLLFSGPSAFPTTLHFSEAMIRIWECFVYILCSHFAQVSEFYLPIKKTHWLNLNLKLFIYHTPYILLNIDYYQFYGERFHNICTLQYDCGSTNHMDSYYWVK